MMQLNLRAVAFLALVGLVAANSLPKSEEETLRELPAKKLIEQLKGNRYANNPKHTKMVIDALAYRSSIGDHSADSEIPFGLMSTSEFVDSLEDLEKITADRCNSQYLCGLKFMAVMFEGLPALKDYTLDVKQRQLDFCHKLPEFKKFKMPWFC